MSQKVNPIGIRTGHFREWKSKWFSDDSKFKFLLLEDIKVRDYLMKRLVVAGIDNVEIARLPKSVVITVYVSRPGVVIGRGGSGIEELKKELLKLIRSIRGVVAKDLKLDLQVKEVREPELSARLVATRIAGELERRMPHRRVVTKTIERVMGSGAIGVKIVLGGRVGGANIARTEKFSQGPVPTQTLRENIDYAQVPALLKRGYVGIKVWINRPEEKN